MYVSAAICLLQMRSFRVLIIEDDALQQNILCALFSAANDKATAANQKIKFFVTVAGSAKEALCILARSPRHSFELVLIDVLMPDISGVDVLPLVRRAVNETTAIVMMSSESKEDIIERCIRSTADAYLPKPIHLEMIRTIWQFGLQRDPSLFDLHNRAGLSQANSSSAFHSATDAATQMLSPATAVQQRMCAVPQPQAVSRESDHDADEVPDGCKHQ
mmetsp:Transcript_74082/g.123753  ORF Transcript_74082/g.123753 Transcript_74082/m.123753 type:complete len:218 (+) Transcript_74082:18-671(+)